MTKFCNRCNKDMNLDPYGTRASRCEECMEITWLEQEEKKKQSQKKRDYLNYRKKKDDPVFKLKRKEYCKEWYSKNKEHQKQKVKESYFKNKKKWNSRSITGKILKSKNFTKLIKKCRECGTPAGIEIHHEIYPTKKKEILEAIEKGKIYYLCKKHHAAKRETSNKSINFDPIPNPNYKKS